MKLWLKDNCIETFQLTMKENLLLLKYLLCCGNNFNQNHLKIHYFNFKKCVY